MTGISVVVSGAQAVNYGEISSDSSSLRSGIGVMDIWYSYNRRWGVKGWLITYVF